MGKHVFICGYSRSGTTMLYNMLRTTVTNFRFLEREMAARRVIGATPDDHVTKRPLDILDIDRILAANTLGKKIVCIVMVRDMRGLVTSRHVSVPDDYFISYDRQYAIGRNTVTNTNPGIGHVHEAIVAAWRRPDVRKLMLRYENLLRHPDVVQAKLGKLIGFKYRGAFEDFHKHEIPAGLQRTLNTVRPPDPANIESWRAVAHRERIIGQFSRWPQLLRLLKMYGYESDDRWFDAYVREELTSAS